MKYTGSLGSLAPLNAGENAEISFLEGADGLDFK